MKVLKKLALFRVRKLVCVYILRNISMRIAAYWAFLSGYSDSWRNIENEITYTARAPNKKLRK